MRKIIPEKILASKIDPEIVIQGDRSNPDLSVSTKSRYQSAVNTSVRTVEIKSKSNSEVVNMVTDSQKKQSSYRCGIGELLRTAYQRDFSILEKGKCKTNFLLFTNGMPR